MANEDFTTYDETDEGTNVTVIASKVSWIKITRAETSHVSDSKGGGHFGGDFTHKFECMYENFNGFEIINFWALANVQVDWKTIIDASAKAHVFSLQNEEFMLHVAEAGGRTTDIWANPAVSTTYFITIDRDDDGGANNTGQLVALIRTGSHAGALQDTLTVDCAVGEQNDFEYVFGLMSYDDNEAGAWADGFTQNLDLQEVAPSGIVILRRRRM